MIGFVFDILIDLFLFLFPVSMVCREMRLRPKGLSDLKPALHQLGLKRISAKEFLKQAIVVFGALAIASILLALFFSLLQFNDLQKVAEEIVRIKQISPFILAYILIVRVSAEEVFFRGFLVNRVGVIASTALFALAHALYFSYAEVAGAFLLGLILAIAFKKRQNLFPIIVAHILYNFFAISFIYGGA